MKLIKLSALLALTVPISLFAQVAPQLPTNLPNVTTSQPPPAGFNALTASEATLQQYGYPPNPGPLSAAYAGWAKAVSAPQTRVEHPILEMTDMQAGPCKGFKELPSANKEGEEGGTVSAFRSGTSNNWSGFVVLAPTLRPFGGNNPGLGIVYAYWVVPIAQQPFSRVGDGKVDLCLQWVGIDGAGGSSDVLQAGTATGAFANSSGAKQALYAAWIEWFPFNIFQIKNFPVGPGEEIFCQVWNTSPTVGHAFFVDFSRNSSLKVAFSAPQNVRLVGNCAEWIVERPSSSSGLSTLTNYVACPWDNCVAVGSVGAKYNVVYFPATTNAQVFSLTMLDDAGNGISRANLQGLYDLWFRNFGSSR